MKSGMGASDMAEAGEFFRAWSGWLSRLLKMRESLLFLVSVCSPPVLAILGALSNLDTSYKIGFTIALCVLAAVTALIGYVISKYDSIPSDLVEKITSLSLDLTATEAENGYLRKSIEALGAQYSCLSTFVDARDGVDCGRSEEAIESAIDAVFVVLISHKERLFNFDVSEKWNFAFYIMKDGVLKCRFCKRNFSVSPSGYREWPPGQGHVGLAFHQQDELIEEDISGKPIYQGRGPLLRAYDEATYRSIVSIYVADIETRDGVGVLVATSNVPGRFDSENAQVVRDAGRVLGEIAAIARKNDLPLWRRANGTRQE